MTDEAPVKIGSWTFYILRCSDGSFYAGITNDLDRRLNQHRDGRASRYTRSRRPVSIIYRESCESRSHALKRECAVKALSRKEKEKLTEGSMKKFSRGVDLANVFKRHHRMFGLLILTAALIVTGFTGEGFAKGKTKESPDHLQAKRISHGEYLVNTSGCHDCHTPWIMKPNGPGPDMSRMLSGHPESLVMPPPLKLEAPWVWMAAGSNTAFAGPWGISYTKNLTPDPTGLGGWTEKEFIAAIRTGKARGTGRLIMPPMPIQDYRSFTDEDLKSIFAYLQTIPPIKNTPPSYQSPPAP
ncbi:MAG: GIY-YIG nuclease family protein [Nitrospirae bacterium]|nr:GIY-YIG nuclease family protein [Nitrospirota bacterium]